MDCIKDLQDAIRNILVNNGLTELCLGEPDELDDPTYIIWYDRHCEPHEDPVLKVYLENEGIAVEVEARSFGNTITVYDYDIDRIEWWKGIHANILEVLERDGKRRCPACGRTVKGKQRYCGAGCRDFIDSRTDSGAGRGKSQPEYPQTGKPCRRKRQGVPEAADREIYRRSVISRLCYTKKCMILWQQEPFT